MWMTEYTQLLHDLETTLVVSLFGSYHDGKEFGILRTPYQIPAFKGVVDIGYKDLPLVPLKFIGEQEQVHIRERLHGHGKMAVRLQSSKFTFLYHDGPVSATEIDGGKLLVPFEDTSWLEVRVNTDYLLFDAKNTII
jgi:hypothetical protein